MKKIKFSKKFIALFLCLGLGFSLSLSQKIFANTNTNNDVDNVAIEYYEYPINIDSEIWTTLSVQEKRDALIIPESILTRMTDSCLYEAFIKYPFIGDVLAYSGDIYDMETPLKCLAEYCSAYQEILRRGISISELKAIYENNANLEQYASNQKNELFKYEGEKLLVEHVIDDITSAELRENPQLSETIAKIKNQDIVKIYK